QADRRSPESHGWATCQQFPAVADDLETAKFKAVGWFELGSHGFQFYRRSSELFRTNEDTGRTPGTVSHTLAAAPVSLLDMTKLSQLRLARWYVGPWFITLAVTEKEVRDD